MSTRAADERKQVLFVTPWYPNPESPAAGVFVREHALAASRFDDIAVVHLARGRMRQRRLAEVEHLADEPLPTVRVRYRPVPYASLPIGLEALRRAVRRVNGLGFSPDLVHVHIAAAGFPCAVYCQIADLPLVVTEHWSIYLDADPARFSRPAEARVRWVLGSAQRVLPVGSALETAMQHLAPRASYEVVPNVVDGELFHPAPARPAIDSVRLIAVGMLSSEKDYPTLLRAIRGLIDSGMPARLQLVGYGSCEAEIDRLVKSLGLADNVELLGYLPKSEVARRLREAHVFVHSSIYETFGVAVAEALASGLPVVSTRCGGPEDYMTPESGRLVSPRDPAALAAGIRHVVDHLDGFDPDRIAADARRRFSAEVVGRRLHEVYRSVGPSRRSGGLIATRPEPLEEYNGVLVHAHPGVHEVCETTLRRYVPPSADVLDLGAGEGAFTLRLVQAGYRVTAVDADQTTWRVPEVPLVEADATQPLASALNESTFDAICCLEVIEHVEDQASLLRQARAVCRPGGFLILTTPNVTSFLSRAIFLRTGRFHQFGDEDLDYGHISPITPWELGVLAERTGWRLRETLPAGSLPVLDVSGGVRGSLRFNLLRLLTRTVARGTADGWCLLFVLEKS